MINPERLQELLQSYAEEAKLFFYSYGLADLVIDLPIDYVSLKALDSENYQKYLMIYAPLSKRLTKKIVGEREIATCELYEQLNAGTFGTVKLLEIMEPKPGKIATTYDLIDHIGIRVPVLEDIRTALKTKEVIFTEQTNQNHVAIVVEINEWGQEVKFTDRSFFEITKKQIATETSKLTT